MGELYNPYPKLPRNIRQIGEKEDTTRLYVEDYVNTYLKGLLPATEEQLRVGLLLGNVEVREGVPFLFLDGAMELEELSATIGNVEFTEAIWKKAYQDIEQMFPKRTIQGWFLCGAKGSQLKSVDYWKVHGQHFAGKYKLMYLNSGEEGEEEVYIAGEDGLNRLKGYCIYYERNQMMQDYMILRNDAKRIEAGVHDRVTRDFKDRMAERKGQIQSQRSTVRMLTGVCGALSLAVLAGGIVMFNNYSQMRQMESVIASVLPQGSSVSEKEGGETNTEGEIEIQMVAGGVYPTQAVKEEGDGANQETIDMSQTMQGQETLQKVEISSTESETLKEAGGTQSSNSDESAVTSIESKENSSSMNHSTANTSNEDGSNDLTTSESSSKTSKDTPKQGGNQTAAEADSGIWEVKDAMSGETMRYYTVGDWETLYGICLKLYHSLSNIDTIIELNGLESQDKIIAGQKLQIP